MTLAAHLRLDRGALCLDVALEVERGEVLALLGPNGAGKTTILRALAGLEELDDGSVVLDGRVLDDPASGVFVEPDERGVGVVFQDYVLFEHLSVLENVAFGPRARGTSRREARDRAAAWLHRVGLADRAGVRPAELSGGQAQRVALARALAAEPRLFLLDEPLAALDAGTRAAVRRDLRQHLDEFDGVCVLVSHDPVDAYALSDRVAVVEDGRIVQQGALAEVTAHPRSRYVADLVGVNLFAGVVADGALRTPEGAAIVVADAPPGPAFVVVRPHSVTLTRDPSASASARNVWRGVITEVDRLGERARVMLEGELRLTAEVTVAALDALGLHSGDEVHAAVKATDIEVFPA